jgi:hypothetical protein
VGNHGLKVIGRKITLRKIIGREITGRMTAIGNYAENP